MTDLVALADVDEDEVLRLAASLESQSDHPIAAGIVAAAKDRGIDLSPRRSSGRFRATARRRGVDGTNIKVVSPGYLREQGLDISDAGVRALAGQEKTVVYVIREASRDALARLKEMGIRVMMLTGDAEAVAR